MTYLTDGVHLYEVERRDRNVGLQGGWFVQVVDCMTGLRRVLAPIEQMLCSVVLRR